MRLRFPFLLIMVLLGCGLVQAKQNASSSDPEYSTHRSGESDNNQKKERTPIFTGFSGGMMIHGGYSFSENPQQLFGNKSLEQIGEDLKNLPYDGVTLGLGGTLRFALIDHIHVGGEGHVSIMPLSKNGSNVRTGWGGGFVDGYLNISNFRPMLGLVIGGGTMRRLYVPDQEAVQDEKNVDYNASYVTNKFFMLDPYIGFEVGLAKTILLLKIDYMLPFGSSETVLAQDVSWGNFLTPSGFRIYLGFLFGH